MPSEIHTNTAVFYGWGWRESSLGVCIRFDEFVEAYHLDEVGSALSEVEHRTQNGLVAFGFISYEAGGAFDTPVRIESNTMLPLAWFGFCAPGDIAPFAMDFLINPHFEGSNVASNLRIDRDVYTNNIDFIKGCIGRGETYQVNYTLRSDVRTKQSGLELFARLYNAQPVPYAAYIQTKEWEVHSLSPELFLAKSGDRIESKPMKGTWARGRTLEEDRKHAALLHQSEKNRAENIMILDMARNDLGRVCKTGSVRSSNICQVERYRSLYQMTSTVSGNLDGKPSLTDILRATFPAASITGAPKKRTMEIIREMEGEPRGVYCGSIGLVRPNGDFVFNVAIRTLWGSKGRYELGVGGGIVWDSNAEEEWREIQTKSAFVQSDSTPFSLIETIRLDADGTFVDLNEHLERLAASADYWAYPFERDTTGQRLIEYAQTVAKRPAAVRLTLDERGQIDLSHRSPTYPPACVRVRIASNRTNSNNRFLYHKTTRRALYNAEREAGLKRGFFETVFTNENGCVTEGCITNLFFRRGEDWFTPPLYDGLLPGVWRGAFMLETNACERSVTVGELREADEIRIGNSVIGGIRVDAICVDA